jgi:hypothetical protein
MTEETSLLYLNGVNVGPLISNATYVKALKVKFARAKKLPASLISRTVIIQKTVDNCFGYAASIHE